MATISITMAIITIVSVLYAMAKYPIEDSQTDKMWDEILQRDWT